MEAKLISIQIGIGESRYSGKNLELKESSTFELKKEGDGKKLIEVKTTLCREDVTVWIKANRKSISFSFTSPSSKKPYTRTGQDMGKNAKFAKGTFCTIKIG